VKEEFLDDSFSHYNLFVLKYYLFLDESGDHGLNVIDQNFPVFALCGVIISEPDYQQLINDFHSIKQSFWADQKVIFHSRDIRKCEKEFQILLDINLKSAFIEQLNRVIQNANYSIIASVIDKTEYLKRYGKLNDDVYEVALSFILERAVFYLDTVSDNIDNLHMVIEARGKKEDVKLKNHLDRLLNLGTYYVNAQRIKNYNTRYEFKPKYMNICGLQLSDLVAYPVARYAIDTSRANPAFDVFKNKIYAKGGKRYGLKIFP